MVDNTVIPFQIAVLDKDIDDLRLRLSLARLPDELEEAEWDMGSPLSDIKRLVNHWKDQYDWRQAEERLNRIPQFTTRIHINDDIDFGNFEIHFMQKRSSITNSIPLIFVHGWPGSFIEVTKIIDKLTESSDGPAFDVVAPSLPNFGFSDSVHKRGFGLEHYAECCHKLMMRLGYDQYVTQGGDDGYYITRTMSLLYPAHCKATHLNFEYATGPPSFLEAPWAAFRHAIQPYTETEKQGLERTRWFLTDGSGYQDQMSTRPQTIGYALQDSPVALLSWVYEKLHDWTDSYPWTDDEVCTWISIYWFSKSGPAATVRIYYEIQHNWRDSANKVTPDRVGRWIDHVKIGFSRGPKELRILPAAWRQQHGNIVFERTHDRGGHFFAYEQPDLLVKDIKEMFGRGGGAYAVVSGKTGY